MGAPDACAARQLGQEGPNQNPLLVGEVMGMRRSRKGIPARMVLSRSDYGLRPKSVVRSPFPGTYPLDQTGGSWNPLISWLREIEALRRAA